MGTGKGRTNKLKNIRQMLCVFERAIHGEEQSPRYGFVAYPFNHRDLRENTENHGDKKISILCGNLSAHGGNKTNTSHPSNHRVLRESTEKHRDKKLSVLCGNLSALGGNTNNHTTNTIQAFKHRHCSISATTYAYSSSHKVEWYPHTHDHSTLFSSITILQIMDTARDQYVSHAGHYTIRPPAGTCRGNPP